VVNPEEPPMTPRYPHAVYCMRPHGGSCAPSCGATATQSAFDEGRREALEEAAKLCGLESAASKRTMDERQLLAWMATRIRALKEKAT
jgi:hypothetical protein